jgi:hypothetical protein
LWQSASLSLRPLASLSNVHFFLAGHLDAITRSSNACLFSHGCASPAPRVRPCSYTLPPQCAKPTVCLFDARGQKKASFKTPEPQAAAVFVCGCAPPNQAQATPWAQSQLRRAGLDSSLGPSLAARILERQRMYLHDASYDAVPAWREWYLWQCNAVLRLRPRPLVCSSHTTCASVRPCFTNACQRRPRFQACQAWKAGAACLFVWSTSDESTISAMSHRSCCH